MFPDIRFRHTSMPGAQLRRGEPARFGELPLGDGTGTVSTDAEHHSLQNPGAGTLKARRTAVHKTLIYSILLMAGHTVAEGGGFCGGGRKIYEVHRRPTQSIERPRASGASLPTSR